MSLLTQLTQTNGKSSGTKLWFTVASVIVLSKYAVAGATIMGSTFAPFDAQGAAILLSVFAGTYVARRNVRVGVAESTGAK